MAMRPREVIRYAMVSAASLLSAISYCFSMLLWLYITVASVGVIDYVLCLPGMMDVFCWGVPNYVNVHIRCKG